MKEFRVSDHIRYLTLQITTSDENNNNWTGTGTGFLYAIEKDGTDIPLLVTNKHVIDGVKRISLTLHVTVDNNETPVSGPGKEVYFDTDDVPILRHPDPDVDLAAIPIAPLIRSIEIQHGWKPFIRCLGKRNLPSNEMITEFSAIEDIIMIGYPKGIVDHINNYPTARRGITSTPYIADYKGKREFLADIPVYGGSSGSPIFILNEGSWMDRGQLFGGSSRFSLIGVLYAGHTETVSGDIVAEQIPTIMRPVAKVKHMINLGLCIKSALIEELAHQISKENLVKPQS